MISERDKVLVLVFSYYIKVVLLYYYIKMYLKKVLF